MPAPCRRPDVRTVLKRMVAAGLRAGSSRTRPDVKRPVSLGDWVVEVVIGGRMVDVMEIVGLLVVVVEVVPLVGVLDVVVVVGR